MDVLFAPGYDDDALDALRRKPEHADPRSTASGAPSTPASSTTSACPAGCSCRTRDWEIEDATTDELVAGSLGEEQWGDLVFAWRVCKHVSSNAIVIAKDLQTIGIGAGQQSRVDAVRIALEKAQSSATTSTGAVLASDAFFPFADGPELALDAASTSIVQPGGSKPDDEVVAAVEQAGAAMVFTGRRHFRH